METSWMRSILRDALVGGFETRRKHMEMNRRAMLTNVLAGAAVAAVGVTVIGWVAVPGAVEAAPINIAKPAGTPC